MLLAETNPELAAPILCHILSSLVNGAMHKVNMMANFMVQNLRGHHVPQNWQPFPPCRFRLRNVVYIHPYCRGRRFPGSRIRAGGLGQTYLSISTPHFLFTLVSGECGAIGQNDSTQSDQILGGGRTAAVFQDHVESSKAVQSPGRTRQ